MKKGLKTFAIALGVFALFTVGCSDSHHDDDNTGDDIVSEIVPMGDMADTWLAAEDHCSHDKMIEWWYFTGDMYTVDGRRFGYEVTLFKTLFSGLETFITHTAITDIENEKHYFEEKIKLLSEQLPTGTCLLSCEGLTISIDFDNGFLLNADTGNMAIDMTVMPTRYPMLNGEDGVVTMPDGNSSYYYSFTNADSGGTLTLNGEEFDVSGRTWMDHQWGDYHVTGSTWDWFSVRFEDGSALMLSYSGDRPGRVIFHNSDGSVFKTTTYEIKEISTSRDYQDESATYRLGWQIIVEELALDIVVDPIFDAQSLYGDIIKSYWEGMCDVTGTIGGNNVTASAYVELTGYDSE